MRAYMYSSLAFFGFSDMLRFVAKLVAGCGVHAGVISGHIFTIWSIYIEPYVITSALDHHLC